MSEVQDFYLRQVALSAKAASDSGLANQRDKYLRSQAAWQALADRDPLARVGNDAGGDRP